MSKKSGGQSGDEAIAAKDYTFDLDKSKMETTEDNSQEMANKAASKAKGAGNGGSGGDSDSDY